MKEMLAMQKEMEDSQAKEAQLAAHMQDNKKRLLTDLAKEEARRDEAVKRLQVMKEKEKEQLIDSLYSGKLELQSFSEAMSCYAYHEYLASEVL